MEINQPRLFSVPLLPLPLQLQQKPLLQNENESF
jgi:hypothetical protein